MTGAWVVIIAAVGFLALAALWALRQLCRGPFNDPLAGLLWRATRLYCRVWHRAVYRGRDVVPDTEHPGGLIVVANHTGPIDPLLLQSACYFHIRWMMAEEMMTPNLSWLWRRQRVIPVARDGADLSAAREAIRHVREGGVLGIFPEGGIVRPAGELRPFQEGVGLIISRTAAPVLLAWIRGTPAADTMMPALKSRSRSEVDFLGLLDLTSAGGAKEITAVLRSRLAEASGWPLNDEPLRPAPKSPGDFSSGAELVRRG